VDWTDEQECFDTFLRELALFYTPPALDFDLVTDKNSQGENDHIMTDDIDETMTTDPSQADKTLKDEVAFAKRAFAISGDATIHRISQPLEGQHSRNRRLQDPLQSL
jgi:hypothetical protein